MTFEFVPGIPKMQPYVNQDNREFFDAMNRQELVFQRCKNCALYLHPPRPMCPRCMSTESEWIPSTGNGSVYSFVSFVYDKAAYPGIKVPYAVALIELENEKVRMLSNIMDVAPADIYIDMPVELTFVEIEKGRTLAMFNKKKK